MAQLAGGVIRVRSIEGDEVGWGSVAGWSEDACAVAARRAFGICNNTLDRCEVPVLCWGWAAAELEARAQGIIGPIFTQIITTTSRFCSHCCCRIIWVVPVRKIHPRDLIWKCCSVPCTLPSCLCYQVEAEGHGKRFSRQGLLPRTQSAYRLTQQLFTRTASELHTASEASDTDVGADINDF